MFKTITPHTNRRPVQIGALGLTLVLLAACNTTGRGNNDQAPPPMKPIDTGALGNRPAPAPAPTVSQPSTPAPAPAPVAVAPAPAPTQAPAPAPAAPVAAAPVAPLVAKAGLHRCELSKRVLVKKVSSDGNETQVNWGGKDYSMKTVFSPAGAKRYEDPKAGLAWVVIAAKSFLLDTKKGQVLANECNL